MSTFPGCKSPFGYTWRGGEFVIAKDEALIYAQMFEFYLIHQRKRLVARVLNEKGYRTRAGKKFTFTAVDRLLQNPIAKSSCRFVRKTDCGS